LSGAHSLRDYCSRRSAGAQENVPFGSASRLYARVSMCLGVILLLAGPALAQTPDLIVVADRV
jgi:hypothetical protein